MVSPFTNEQGPMVIQGGPSSAAFVVGEVSPDSYDSSFSVQAGDFGIFTDYYVLNRYEFDTRKYMLGITAVGTAALPLTGEVPPN